MRYWAYVHDLDGEMVEDFGDFEDQGSAIDKICEFLPESLIDGFVCRIVDYENEGQTCWIAGPMEYMKDYFAAHFGVEDRSMW